MTVPLPRTKLSEGYMADIPRLAVYGTLAPGKPNHHRLADLEGRWIAGSVLGQLADRGWGAALGYPGLILKDNGDAIAVQVLESHDLTANWERLDAFEGAGYRRVRTWVDVGEERLEAWIYVLA